MKKQPTLEELIEQCEMTLSEMDTMLMKMKLLTSLIKKNEKPTKNRQKKPDPRTKGQRIYDSICSRSNNLK